MSSICSLPDELHLEIFAQVRALINDDDEEIPDTPTVFRDLSHVCSLWRTLLTNTSMFWTDIVVTEQSFDTTVDIGDARATDEETFFHCMPWTSVQLGRSGPRPVNVYVDFEHPHFDGIMSEMQNLETSTLHPKYVVLLSRILQQFAAKIRVMQVTSDLWLHIQALAFGLTGVSMPLLEVWDVGLNRHRDCGHQLVSDIPREATMPAIECPPGCSPSPQFGAAMYPNLRQVSLKGVRQDWSRFGPANLVSLDLESLPMSCRPTPQELSFVLALSQSTLESLTLWTIAPQGVGFKVTLPKLSALSLGFSFAETALYLPQYLDLPNLRSLDINDLTHDNPANFSTPQRLSVVTAVKQEMYMQMIARWPLKQVKSLTLRCPSFGVANFDDVKVAYIGRRLPVSLPLPMSFLLRFTSLRNLRLINPDRATLEALSWPLWCMKEVTSDSRAAFACSNLDNLEIYAENLKDIYCFLRDCAGWAVYSSEIVRPRTIGTISLDVPPEWGHYLLPVLSSTMARQVLNSRTGSFLAGPKLPWTPDFKFQLQPEFDVPAIIEEQTMVNLLG